MPVAFDNLITGWKDAVKFGPFEQGDLLNIDSVRSVFDKHQPAAVMHFAALSDVGQSVREPGRYWRNNVVGSMNLLDVMVERECNRIVFSSTCATYGDQDGVTLDETCAQNPINAYGGSKKAVEDMLENYGSQHDLRSVVFRYFNVAGADPDAEIGEHHRPETHLIPLILDALEGKRDHLTVFGTDYETDDGTCIRDYVHVTDLVDAHVKGLEYLNAGHESRVFNLGTGHGFSVLDVIKTAETVTEKPVPHEFGERRPGDCRKLVSGSDRAAKELGWTPDNSTLDAMVSDAWRWHSGPGYKT